MRDRKRVWQRLKRVSPTARRKLLEHLFHEVARGAATPLAALERYEDETRWLPWKAFLAPLDATNRLFSAAVEPERSRDTLARTIAATGWVCTRCGFVLRFFVPVPGGEIGRCVACDADAVEPVHVRPVAGD
jgi:hypothetical protein